jgi:hypothetical protein
MHASDILLECSKECARLSRECCNEKLADELFQMSTRLFRAAARDAELVRDDIRVPAADQVVFPSGS